ncbi:hypothetical protein OUZ56_008415 [Daphnia magna]|uniref:Uncharacterized protein n=1 Tax=Daphnia magna TaxID=35525 RepID=A0ABR0AD17_9CRUS|nr:hypothetical protein OUZ56_008415 [Daphnia magna]
MEQPTTLSQEQLELIMKVKKEWKKLFYVIQRREGFERGIMTPQLALKNYIEIHTGKTITRRSTKLLSNFWESLTEDEKTFWYNVSITKNAGIKEKQKLVDEEIAEISQSLKSMTFDLLSSSSHVLKLPLSQSISSIWLFKSS